jgi:hypothetical protein
MAGLASINLQNMVFSISKEIFVLIESYFNLFIFPDSAAVKTIIGFFGMISCFGSSV